MKAIILFYSYTGKTKALAEKKSHELGADIEEIKDLKRPGTIAAYVVGSLRARRQKQAAISPIQANLADYENIIIMAPLWAGYPAPAMNNILEALPAGKQIDMIITSGSGNSSASADNTKALITAKGCEVISYTDVKS